MNAAYQIEQGRPVIYLFARDENRERRIFRITTFRPYFYVPDENGPIVDIFGRRVRKVYTQKPTDVRTEREFYPWTDEADIPFVLRYLIDANVRCGFTIEDGKVVPANDPEVPPKILYFDIEVESPIGILPRPSNPIHPIVSIQCANNYDDWIDIFLLVEPDSSLEHQLKQMYRPAVRFHTFTDERKMLLAFANWVREVDPDVLTAYNGELFDVPYLLRRARYLQTTIESMSPFKMVTVQKFQAKTEVTIKGREFLDMFRAYQKWSTGRQGVQSDQPFGVTYDFKRVVAREAGFTYEDYGDRIIEIRHNEPESFLDYCYNDAYALKLLDQKADIIAHFDRLRRLIGVPLSWALSHKKLIDTELLRETDRPLPTTEPAPEDAEVKGALVFEPPPGVFENVACFDLKSIYPSVIIGFNLSPETKDPNGEIVVGQWRFRREPEGLLPKVTRKFVEERERLRQLRRQVEDEVEKKRIRQREVLYKFLAASMYGVCGYRRFRLFDPDVANAITFLGRSCIRECERVVRSRGYQVLYADTDSLFIKLKSRQDVETLEHLLNETLRKFTEKLGGRQPPVIKFERLFRRILFKASEKGSVKKRYAGVTTEGDLYIMGFEPRRSSTAEVTRTVMKEFFKKVLVDDDVNGAIRLLQETWNRLPELPIQSVAIPRGIRQTEYKVKNPWVTGVEYSTKYLGITFREDKKPRLVYVRGVRGKPPTHAICITEDVEELPPEVIVDWNRMREVVLKKPFVGILAAIGLDWSVVTKGIRQSSMDRWLG